MKTISRETENYFVDSMYRNSREWLKDEYRERVARIQHRVGHFFDPNTMRGFGCRIHGIEPLQSGVVLFVTSEQDTIGRHHAWNGERRYSVRYMLHNGNIGEIGEFGSYDTSREARKVLNLAKQAIS